MICVELSVRVCVCFVILILSNLVYPRRCAGFFSVCVRVFLYSYFDECMCMCLRVCILYLDDMYARLCILS